jgi:hypothetical protein
VGDVRKEEGGTMAARSRGQEMMSRTPADANGKCHGGGKDPILDKFVDKP